MAAERLVEPDDELFGVMLEAGYIYLEMRQFEAARSVFEGVHALAPASEVPKFCLGNAFFAEGNFRAALKAHQEAIAINPDAPAPYAHAGETLLFLGRTEEAIEHLDKAIALDANSPGGQFAAALKEAQGLGVFSAEVLGRSGVPEG